MSTPVVTPTILATPPAAGATPPPAPPAASSGTPPPPSGKTDIPLFEGDESWKSSLPKELLDDPTIKNVRKIDDAMKMLVSAQKKIGEKGLLKPGKHSTDDDWTKFFREIGQPESMDDYKVDLPDGMPKDTGFAKDFLEQAFKANVLPSQAKKILDWYQGASTKAMDGFKEAQAKAQEKVTSELKAEWGQAFDKKIAAAQTVLRSIYDKDQADALMNDPVLANNPKFLRHLDKLSAMVGEDKLKGDFKGEWGSKSPLEAQREINKIMGDKNHPYNQKDHPNHKAAVEDMNRLFEQNEASA